MLIHRRGELLVALGGLRPGDADLDPDSREPGPDAVVEAEESADVEITVNGDNERVERDAQVLGPEAVGDGLAGSERGQRVLDWVRCAALAAERGRLVDAYLVRPARTARPAER
jgi:hypothetical protein